MPLQVVLSSFSRAWRGDARLVCPWWFLIFRTSVHFVIRVLCNNSVRIWRILLRLSECWTGIRLKVSELRAASSHAFSHGYEFLQSIEAVIIHWVSAGS
jgi:hypothetical protein